MFSPEEILFIVSLIKDIIVQGFNIRMGGGS